MTATNHALTGVLIGLAVGNPWIALPASLASHFVCDAIPHFGQGRNNPEWLRSRFFKRLLIADAIACVALVIVLWSFQPTHWLLAAACAFIATSPDFYWIGKFRSALAHKSTAQNRGFGYFASIIQWFQKPSGAAVEIAWTVGMIVLIMPFLL